MKCFEVESYFLDFLSHELAIEQKKEVLLHLEQCALCRTFYTEMKKTEELLCELPEDLTPTELLRKTDKKLFQKKKFNWKIINIAAGFIFIVSVGFFIHTQKKQVNIVLSSENKIQKSEDSSFLVETPHSLRVENVSYQPETLRTSWTQNTFRPMAEFRELRNFLNENIQTQWYATQPFTMQVGQQAILPGGGARLRLKEILYSPCDIPRQCNWSGVGALYEFFDLSTQKMENIFIKKDHNGHSVKQLNQTYLIEIIDISPQSIQAIIKTER